VSVNASYFRRIYGNFVVTDNRAVAASDFTPYCVPVPADSRLPNAGGQLCGLFNLNPNRLGLINNVVTSSNNYGNQYEHWNGFDLTTTARVAKVLVQGGISSGKTMVDNCDIAKKYPQVVWSAPPAGSTPALTTGGTTSTEFCRIEEPFLTQIKLLGSYTLPWDIQVAGTFQNLPGSNQISANAVFTNAVVAPSLGRPLSGASTVTVNVLPPATLYGDRVSQVDLRFAKIFRLHDLRVKGMIDVYNALNNNTVLFFNSTYGSNGAAWFRPITILPARTMKIGAQIDF
jgi:hypothetical protein